MAYAKTILYPTQHSWNGIVVIPYVGNINTITDADGIVTGEGDRFENESCITKALLQISPMEFAQKRHDMKIDVRKFKQWTVYTTELLPPTHFRFVFHAITKNSCRKWTKNMKKMYKKLLEKADKCKVKTLVLPLLGTGRANASVGDAVEAVILSIMKFRKPHYLKKIYLVTLNEDIAVTLKCDCMQYFMKSRVQKENCCFRTTDEDRTAYEKTSCILPEASADTKTTEHGTGHQKRQKKNSSKDNKKKSSRQRRWSSTNINTTDEERTALQKKILTGSTLTYRSMALDGNQRHSSQLHASSQRGYGTGHQDLTKENSNKENKAVNVLDHQVFAKRKRFLWQRLLSCGSLGTSDEEKRVHDKTSIDGPNKESSLVNQSLDRKQQHYFYQDRPRRSDTFSERSGSQHKRDNGGSFQEDQKSKSNPFYKETWIVSPNEKRQIKNNLQIGKTHSQNSEDHERPETRDIIHGDDSSRESYTFPRRSASQPRHNEDGSLKGDFKLGRQRESATACSGGGYQERKDTHSDKEKKAVNMLDVSVISKLSNCPICISPITDPKRLDKCDHVFCRKCIDDSFKYFKPVCPSCNMVYGVLTGNEPVGNMDVGFSGDHLPGYEGHGTITITYYFPSGIQGKEHPNPGQQYKGTTRRAYLPDCPEGREILRLLKTAFDRKLTFTIGCSVTTGQDNVVTWNDIHHKTNMDGGPTRFLSTFILLSKFGYPDPNYLARVKDELASKDVTEAQTNGRAVAKEERTETHL